MKTEHPTMLAGDEAGMQPMWHHAKFSKTSCFLVRQFVKKSGYVAHIFSFLALLVGRRDGISLMALGSLPNLSYFETSFWK